MRTLLTTAVGSIFLSLSLAQGQATGPLGFGAAELQEEMETDRPDFTEGTRTVEQGHFQLEAGYTYTYDSQATVANEQHSYPELLLRLGLLSDLELRVAWEGYLKDRTTEGLSDISLGVKHRMYEQDGLFPAVSFIFESSLPTGESEVAEDELQPSFKLLWAYDLSQMFAIAGNVNFDFPVEDGSRFYETAASVALGADLGPVGSYLEYVGVFPDSEAPDSTSTHILNGGLTLPLTDNLQFDVRAGFGLNSESEDFFSGAGISLRV